MALIIHFLEFGSSGFGALRVPPTGATSNIAREGEQSDFTQGSQNPRGFDIYGWRGKTFVVAEDGIDSHMNRFIGPNTLFF